MKRNIGVGEIYTDLISHFNTFKLGMAGRLVYYDELLKIFILGIHSSSPENALEIANFAWDNLPIGIRNKLTKANIGFAVRMI